jgi:hypothetical protein
MGKREHESTTFYLALTLLGEGSATVPIALVKSPACSQKRGAGSVCSTPQPADNRIKGCDVLQVEPALPAFELSKQAIGYRFGSDVGPNVYWR